MTPRNVYDCIEAALELPVAKQAVCVRIAAEASRPVWRQWSQRRGVEDLSGALLQLFDRWLDGDPVGEELNEMAERLYASLPEDVRKEKEPGGVYAACALVDIALIALDRCGEVHHSAFQTAICFAAAASCGIGAEAAWGALDRLTPPELAFMQSWWEGCRRQFPELPRCE